MAAAVVVGCKRAMPVLASSVYDLIPRILNFAQTGFGNGLFAVGRDLPPILSFKQYADKIIVSSSASASSSSDVKSNDYVIAGYRLPYAVFLGHPKFDALLPIKAKPAKPKRRLEQTSASSGQSAAAAMSD